MYLLFLSTKDAERSQMAAALARQMYGDAARVESAGLVPAAVHPMTVQTMAEINIDLRDAAAKTLDDVDLTGLSLAVVIEGRDLSSSLPAGVKRLHWPLVDPLDPPTSDQTQLRQRFLDTRTALAKHMKMLARLGNRI